jgi:phosphoadenosine phosphosulfate reductase
MSDLLQDAQTLVADVLTNHAEACITCSYQIEDMVVVDLVRQVRPDVPVLFLDTGYHFKEVYAYRDQMVAHWNLNASNMIPMQTVAEQESQFGILYQSKPTECCNRRKVEPLMRGLQPFDAWFTGLRREQSPTRAKLETRETHVLPTGKSMAKISALAHWTMKDVLTYATIREIPLMSLYEQGYWSIGCEPCTAKPAEGADPRTGRWGGNKLECGIHTFTEQK